MTTSAAAVHVLVALGASAELMCCLGLLWFRDVFDRLHFMAAGTTVGPVLLGAAVALSGTSSGSATVQLLVALVALVLANPVLTHATARAFRGGRSRSGGRSS